VIAPEVWLLKPVPGRFENNLRQTFQAARQTVLQNNLSRETLLKRAGLGKFAPKSRFRIIGPGTPAGKRKSSGIPPGTPLLEMVR
jgi:hypothetical protein